MKLVKNFLFLTGGEVLSKVLTVVAIAYVARVVGPKGFGYLEFAMSFVLLAGVLVHQGLGLYGAREIGRDPALTDQLVAEIVSIRFALTAIAYASLILFVYLADRPAVAEQLVLLYGLSLLFMPLGLQWVFQGHERMQTVAVLQITRQAVFAIAVFAFLRDPSQLWPIAIAEVAGVAAVAAGSIWLYRRQLGRRITLPGRFSRKLIREGGVIGLSRLFWSARIFGATVVLGLIASAEDVGFFGAAMRVLIGLHVFIWLYFINLLPSMSRGWGEEGSIQRQIARSMHLVSWLSIGAGVVWVLLSSVAIKLLYGSAFTPAVPVLQWLGVVCVVAAIHEHYRFALISANRQQDEMMTSALGTLISLSLIPVGYNVFGVTGAALALLAGEIAIWFSSWLYCRRHLQLGDEIRFLVRPLICVALLFAVFRILPVQVSLGAQVTIAVIGLGIAAYLSDAEVRRSAKQVVSLW